MTKVLPNKQRKISIHKTRSGVLFTKITSAEILAY